MSHRHVTSLHVHLVFVTKYRRRVLTDLMLTACEEKSREVCTMLGASLVEFNGETDHVHLLVTYPPTIAISDLVRRIKGATAHYLRAEFPGPCNRARMHGHVWTPSYYAASAGGAPLDVLKQYIEDQDRPGNG